MKARQLLVAGMTVVALAVFAGCQPAAGGGGGSDTTAQNDNDNTGTDGNSNTGIDGNANVGDDGTGGETDDNANAAGEDETDDNENAATTQNDNAADGETELTDEEAEAVDAGVTAVINFTGLFAALAGGGLPTLGDGPIIINPVTGCPTITPDESDGATVFTIDYGEGCSPVLYPDSTFSGSITGQVNLVDGTVTLTFNDFVMDGISVQGEVVASISQDGDLLIVAATADVTLSEAEESLTYTGDLTVQINPTTGELFIPTADLAVTDQTGDTYAVLLDDVHIDLIEVLPDSGTATVVLGTTGPGALEVEITFTEDTPTDGTVSVSVNGLEPVKISLEDLEDLPD